jgi:2-polyprenyl-6-hydroxyphenyl methylase/3-demethylubiquinone-9 3-methyltransferase
MDDKTSILTTSSPEEVARFTAMAESWWNPDGKFKPLHRFNPVRLGYMRRVLSIHFSRDPAPIAPFTGLTLLDVGCGGGLLSEPLARMGFAVTGIDAGDRNIGVATTHAEQSGLQIDYRVGGPETLGNELFDVVISMEVIEHVPDPQAFLNLTAQRLKPGGIFIGATMNRTAKAYALAIVGAEYVLGWLPKGTHDWKKFVKPSEFATYLRNAHVETKEIIGASYNMVSGEWVETPNLDVNYMILGVKG